MASTRKTCPPRPRTEWNTTGERFPTLRYWDAPGHRQAPCNRKSRADMKVRTACRQTFPFPVFGICKNQKNVGRAARGTPVRGAVVPTVRGVRKGTSDLLLTCHIWLPKMASLPWILPFFHPSLEMFVCFAVFRKLEICLPGRHSAQTFSCAAQFLRAAHSSPDL